MPSAPAELVALRAGELEIEPVNPFKWGEVEVASREWLKLQTEQIHTLAYRTACDLVRIGQLLAAVREKIPKGTFCRWAESELPWNLSHCYRLMSVGNAFGPYISHGEKDRIEPSALYLLASPSVPLMAREHAIELTEIRRVTVKDARRILAEHKQTTAPVVEPTRGEMRVYERKKKKLGLDEKPAAVEIAEPTMKEKAWDALETLATTWDTVHITRIDDTEPYPDEQVPASVTCLGGAEGQGPRNDVGSRLMDVVLRMAGKEGKKKCLKCWPKTKQLLPLSQFSACAKSGDGRNRYCLKCERKRVKTYDQSKQAKKEQEREQTSPAPTAPTQQPPLAS